MTNTDTADVVATAAQVRALHEAGSELVRVTVNNEAAADAVPDIVAGVAVPVIGDFHYNGHLLLTKYPKCAAALAKYRINPGNVGAKRRDEHFRTIIEVALGHGKPVRIGVNWGSLDQQLLTEMMDENARRSDPLDAREVMIEAMLASATRPGGDRTEEVQVAQQVLQSLGLRSFTPQVSACPGCGRTTSTFFQEMAEDIQTHLKEQMAAWRERYPGAETLRVAVMGCVVNGPGESKHADIGVSLPGTFEEPKAPVYVDGKLKVTLKGDSIVADFLKILEDYVETRYGATSPPVPLSALRREGTADKLLRG